MKLTMIVIAAVFLGAQAWVRLAPGDPGRWHVDPGVAPKTFKNGLIHVQAGDGAAFARLDDVIRASARTRVLAGDISDGRITYVTRSLFWGFPDYTTVQLGADGQIIIYARARFGRSDLGVNQARVQAWLQRLQTVQGG